MYYQHGMRDTFDQLIHERAQALSLSPAQLDRVYTTCNEVANWFRQGGLGDQPRIYTQGSIRLQTSISPKLGGGFDSDIVVEMGPAERWRSQPKSLFEMVGNHLKTMPGFAGEIRPKNRCWALIYDSQYHVDITPAIQDMAKGGSAILVVDGLSQSWRSSDPLGYAAWFSNQASLAFSEKSNFKTHADYHLADPLGGSEWLKTGGPPHPLGCAIQLLKRRRDLWFDQEEAPNSMVLTTLAGSFYEGERTASETLLKLVHRIAEYFSESGKPRLVVNPINDVEVLSENWLSNADAMHAFAAFIRETRAQLAKASNAESEEEMRARLNKLFSSN